MSRLAALRPVLPILIGASVMLSLAMGLRQSLGIFVPPLTRDIGISVGDFTIAVAVQNLTWGLLQPFAGALAVSRLLPSMRVAWWALAMAIGISRIYVGVHWPSDVIGGWSFGLLWVLALYAIAEKFELRR